MKTYNANGLAGCVEQRKSRQTGRVVGVYHNPQAGLDDCGGEYPFSTVCEAHGWIVAHRTLAIARRHAADPLSWCEVCNGTFDDPRHTAPQAAPMKEPSKELSKELSIAQVGRQARRDRNGRYAPMYPCEGCGKRIGEGYCSRILPSGRGLVLCETCCRKISYLSDDDAEKVLAARTG